MLRVVHKASFTDIKSLFLHPFTPPAVQKKDGCIPCLSKSEAIGNKQQSSEALAESWLRPACHMPVTGKMDVCWRQ